MLDSILNDLKQYYSTRRLAYDEEAQYVGWKNAHAQNVRFDQLFRIMEGDTSFVVNDLGCGMGHFADFLDDKQVAHTYLGYDMLPEMVDAANDKHTGRGHIAFMCLDRLDDLREADYTVASGIFNLRYGVSSDDWILYMQEALKVMSRSSRKAFAFNALSRYSDPERRRPELHYADPLFVFDYCVRNFSRDVALLHDYGQFDFTILVRTAHCS